MLVLQNKRDIEDMIRTYEDIALAVRTDITSLHCMCTHDVYGNLEEYIGRKRRRIFLGLAFDLNRDLDRNVDRRWDFSLVRRHAGVWGNCRARRPPLVPAPPDAGATSLQMSSQVSRHAGAERRLTGLGCAAS